MVDRDADPAHMEAQRIGAESCSSDMSDKTQVVAIAKYATDTFWSG